MREEAPPECIVSLAVGGRNHSALVTITYDDCNPQWC